MGALETLYALIYGNAPGSGESDLLNAPDRLKLYALQRLLQTGNAYNDVVDANADWEIDREVRLGGGLPFESRQNKKRQSRAEYARQKLAEIKATEAAQSLSTAPKGGPASGGERVPPSIARAEYVGQLASDTGASPYNAAKGQDYNYDEFKSALDRYVSESELESAQADANRRAASVDMTVGGVPLSLLSNDVRERIRKQAGGTPGGGTLSIAGGVTGGDTEEDMRAYVDNYRNTEVDRQIALIEQAFPAANRPPALDARLQDLYTARANRDREETIRQRLPIEAAQAEADLIQAAGMAEYYTEMPKAQRYGDDRAVEIAQIQAGQKSNKEFNDTAQKIVDTLNKDAAGGRNPKARAAATYIGQIINRTDLTNIEKDRRIQEALAAIGYDNVAALTGTNLATPTGEDELDLLMYGTGTE